MGKPRKTPSGWQIRWFDSEGHRKGETLDSYQEAVKRLRKRETEVEQERRGILIPRPQDRTWGDLVSDWLDLARSKNLQSSVTSATSRINAGLTPYFKNYRISEIGIGAIQAYRATIKDRENETKRQYLGYLITLLRHAKDKGWISELPKFRKDRKQVKSFLYLRNLVEVGQFLSAAREHHCPRIFPVYATAVYTGMRKGELAGLQWGDIDLDTRLIMVQRSFESLTKSKHVRSIPILDPLLPILSDWKEKAQGESVFHDQRGNALTKQSKTWRQHFAETLAEAGFPKVQRFGRLMHYIRFHDLRHTFASLWAMRAGDLFKLQKIMGHASITQTMIYAHLHPSTFGEDYSRLGTVIEWKGDTGMGKG